MAIATTRKPPTRSLRRHIVLVVPLVLITACAKYPATIEPAAFTTYAPDAASIDVVFPWPFAGVCVGQFTIDVRETAQTVVVGEVRNSRRKDEGDCAGVASDGMDYAEPVKLEQPVGERAVLNSDGEPLPLRSR